MSETLQKPSQVHLRFKEVKKTDQNLVIDQKDLPWLPGQTSIVPLTEVIRNDGTSFYVGSAIRGERLIRVARELKGKGSVHFKLLYAECERLIDGHRVDRIDNPKTKGEGTNNREIYYTGNRAGIRVYFIEFDKRDGKKVLIRIAACGSKGGEDTTYQVISHDTAQERSKRLLGK